MEIVRTLLLVVEAAACLLLITIILIQKTKGEGLGLAFGGGMGEALFGTRTGNVLTKATIVLGVIFLVNTLVLGILYTRRSERSLMDRQMGGSAPPMAQPAAQPPQQAAPQEPAEAARPSTPTLPGVQIDGRGEMETPSEPATE